LSRRKKKWKKGRTSLWRIPFDGKMTNTFSKSSKIKDFMSAKECYRHREFSENSMEQIQMINRFWVQTLHIRFLCTESELKNDLPVKSVLSKDPNFSLFNHKCLSSSQPTLIGCYSHKLSSLRIYCRNTKYRSWVRKKHFHMENIFIPACVCVGMSSLSLLHQPHTHTHTLTLKIGDFLYKDIHNN
jgi:hypothetical protein